MPNFLFFFTFGSRKLSAGLVKKHLAQSWVSPLFTADQKCAQIEPGPWPSLRYTKLNDFIEKDLQKGNFSLLSI